MFGFGIIFLLICVYVERVCFLRGFMCMASFVDM